MFKNKKNPFVFVTVIFEQTNNTLFVKPKIGLQSQVLISDSNKLHLTIKNFLEFKPMLLYDMLTYDSSFLKNFSFGKKVHINFVQTANVYYSYTTQNYIQLFLNNPCSHIMSASKLYHNAEWMEREQHEFFGQKFKNLKDCRNLFLEYSWNKSIYLKKYNVSDNYDILYNPDDDDHLMFSKLKPTSL